MDERELQDFVAEVNPYQPPNTLPVDQPQTGVEVDPLLSAAKRRQLLWMVLTIACSGVIGGMLREGSGISRLVDLATSITMAVFILRWCEYDRRERGGTRWRYFTPLMVLLPGPVIMVPIYLLATRGSRGFWAIAKAAAFLLLLIAIGAVGALIGNILSGRDIGLTP
jgi:hypothetical protein